MSFLQRLHYIACYALYRCICCLCMVAGIPWALYAQSTPQGGKVLDSLTRQPVAEVLVTLYADGRLLQSVRTNAEGNYAFPMPFPQQDAELSLQCRHVAYQPAMLPLQGNNPQLPQYILLVPRNTELQEVEVKATWRVQEAGDTVKYNPEAYKTPTTQTVAELFSNIPGFKVLPDGRLMYQNRVVHALLLDGDNLSDEQYGILNKNLDVRAVAGIQVFNNYEKNKVLAEAGESNKLAVNLTISDAFKGRITGNVQAGAALPARGMVQTALVNLNRKSKNFLTASANNVAIDNKADAFKVKDGLGAGGSRSLQNTFAQVLQAPALGTPELPAAFTEDNKTFLGSWVGLAKAGKQSDIAYRLSAEEHRVSYLQRGFAQYAIDSFNQWSIADSNRLQKQVTQLAASVTWRHNASAYWAGEWYVQGLYHVPNDHMSRYMSLAVTDTTQLRHRRREGLLQAGYDGAFKIPGLGVYHIIVGYEITNSRVTDRLLSRRFQEVFKYAGADALLIHQNYYHTLRQWHGRLEQVKKWPKLSGRFGLRAMRQSGHWEQQLDWIPAAQASAVPFHNDSQRFGKRGMEAYQYLSWKPAAKHTLRTQTWAGLEHMQAGLLRRQLPVYHAHVEHTWRFRPRYQWVTSVQAVQKLPQLEWLGPDTVLHGQQGLAAGLDTIGSIQQWGGKTALSYSNLTGNNFLLEYAFTRWHHMTGWLPALVPEINFLQAAFLPTQTMHQGNLTFRR